MGLKKKKKTRNGFGLGSGFSHTRPEPDPYTYNIKKNLKPYYPNINILFHSFRLHFFLTLSCLLSLSLSLSLKLSPPATLLVLDAPFTALFSLTPLTSFSPTVSHSLTTLYLSSQSSLILTLVFSQPTLTQSQRSTDLVVAVVC